MALDGVVREGNATCTDDPTPSSPRPTAMNPDS